MPGYHAVGGPANARPMRRRATLGDDAARRAAPPGHVTGSADEVAARAAGVRATIAAAARRAGRDPGGVRVVAVTKRFPAAVARAALDAGLVLLGENYVQEAAAKRAAVAGGTWHLIGGLQRNKVRLAVATFDWIETIDSGPLAQALDAAAAAAGRRPTVLVQVNVAGDAAKRGVPPEATRALCEAVLGCPALALAGLMTIGPAGLDAARMRPYFRGLRELRDDVAGRLGVELPQLSMGMSDDFGVAVEEGATLVRIGRALFGDREG
jgi:PLP dependent protein